MADLCEIISVDLGSSLTKPTIVRFQNGQLQPTKETNLQCAKYSDPKRNKIITAVATNRLVYSGEEDTDDVNTFLAIRNIKTNKVRLVQVNSTSLHPQLNISSMLDETLNNTTISVRDLYKEFGSKKTKRQTEQIEKMKMDATNVEEELKEAVAGIEIKENDLIVPSNIDAGALEYRPPMNRDALRVEEVYDLKTILSQNELNSLETLALEVRDNSTISEQLTPFVMYCVNTLKKTSVLDIEKYEILLYIDALLKFFKLPSKRLNVKKLTIQPYPEIVIEKILKDYTITSEKYRLRPLTFRDKAVCSILVLALIALNYTIDITTLSESIGVGLKKLVEISRTVGAHSLSSNEEQLIILKLPLAPPIKARVTKKKKI